MNIRKIIVLILTLLMATTFLSSCAGSSKKGEIPLERWAKEEYDLRRKWGPLPSQIPHFDYNKYYLRPDAKQIIKKVAFFLKEYPNLNIEIQGHCDERGTIPFNFELGMNRARSVKNYLESLGISPERLTVFSYGKSRPIDPGHNEEAWERNRRVEFVIISD